MLDEIISYDSSAIMVIVGTFCVANSTAAFTSVAFVVGSALLIMGILELVVFRNVGYEENMITKTYVVQAVIFCIFRSNVLVWTGE